MAVQRRCRSSHGKALARHQRYLHRRAKDRANHGRLPLYCFTGIGSGLALQVQSAGGDIVPAGKRHFRHIVQLGAVRSIPGTDCHAALDCLHEPRQFGRVHRSL